MLKETAWGIAAALLLLGIYFGAVTAISGPAFAWSQFADYWYFILPLAAGFGLQTGMYVRIREKVKAGMGMVAATGGTSAASMLACCTHYLVNLLPILGATGVAALAAQYQTELFWAALVINLGGVAYMYRRLRSIPAYEK